MSPHPELRERVNATRVDSQTGEGRFLRSVLDLRIKDGVIIEAT